MLHKNTAHTSHTEHSTASAVALGRTKGTYCPRPPSPTEGVPHWGPQIPPVWGSRELGERGVAGAPWRNLQEEEGAMLGRLPGGGSVAAAGPQGLSPHFSVSRVQATHLVDLHGRAAGVRGQVGTLQVKSPERKQVLRAAWTPILHPTLAASAVALRRAEGYHCPHPPSPMEGVSRKPPPPDAASA